jgi:hypothetical protein
MRRRAASVKLDAEPAIKTPDRYKLLGQSLPRLDVPLKVNGTARYRYGTTICVGCRVGMGLIGGGQLPMPEKAKLHLPL